MSIAIVVPTLGRSHLLENLALNVHQTLSVPHTLLFVVDEGDDATQKVIRPLKRAQMLVHDGTYPQKINAGVRATTEELVVIANDDVKFHPKWYRRAKQAFKDGIQVVGPSDLSPATQEGDHATMPIVRRSYIEDPGAVWGEKGTALHEGYHHNYSETELWALATDRGVAKFVEGCVIEHLHPDWGKGDLDETYERGARQNFDADQELFFKRCEAWRQS